MRRPPENHHARSKASEDDHRPGHRRVGGRGRRLLTTVALWLARAAPPRRPLAGARPGPTRAPTRPQRTALTPPSHRLRDADCRQGGAALADGARVAPRRAGPPRPRLPCPVGGEDGATPCSGNGVCDADEGTCACAPTHTGPDCAVAVPAPDPATVGGKDPVAAGDQVRQCSGHGLVVQDGDTSSCLCDDGWSGVVCDAYEDPSKARARALRTARRRAPRGPPAPAPSPAGTTHAHLPRAATP